MPRSVDKEMKNLTSTPPLPSRAFDTIVIPFAVACALARIASASPEIATDEHD